MNNEQIIERIKSGELHEQAVKDYVDAQLRRYIYKRIFEEEQKVMRKLFFGDPTKPRLCGIKEAMFVDKFKELLKNNKTKK